MGIGVEEFGENLSRCLDEVAYQAKVRGLERERVRDRWRGRLRESREVIG